MKKTSNKNIARFTSKLTKYSGVSSPLLHFVTQPKTIIIDKSISCFQLDF